MVGADHSAQIPRVEPSRQRRRADQVAEYHRELSSFGIGRRRGDGDQRHRCRGRRGGAERNDGIQQLAPIADRRNADLPKILGGQLSQHLGTDFVVAEGGHIALKAQTLEPRLNVTNTVTLGRSALIDVVHVRQRPALRLHLSE